MWERALDVTYTNPTTWLKYAEMEMRHRFINHARNVWDRAVSLLPRVDQLWCAPATWTYHLPNTWLRTCKVVLDLGCRATRSPSRTSMIMRSLRIGLVFAMQVQVYSHGGDAWECCRRQADL